MAVANARMYDGISEGEYKRRIRAWTMYDWANSAFATTILAAVLPIYYSQVAGANLSSANVATRYWSVGLSLSLLIIAILSPILGTISDIMRGKKKFLAVFVGIGVVSTGLLILVTTGDWLLASIFFLFGRIGFSGANVFYDALLPHVAKDEDRDKVSTRGYAMGYLGGGILLAVNAAMILLIPGTWGSRLAFLSVAIWWAVFSIPIFRKVPEPPAAVAKLARGETVIGASFKRIWETILDIRQYRELFKFLVAFLIYNDGIGTIIGVAAIYGAELGFDAVALILALLMVQFVGIPFSLIFGRLPSAGDKRRPMYLAFIIYNIVALPLLGVLSVNYIPAEITGVMPEAYESTATAAGEGVYLSDDPGIIYSGTWKEVTISPQELGTDLGKVYNTTSEGGASYDFSFNGQQIQITHSQGLDHGIWAVYLDGAPLIDPDEGTALVIDAYNPTPRFEVQETFGAEKPGEHILQIVNTEQSNPDSSGNVMSLGSVEVLSAAPQSNLGVIIGLILAVEALGLLLSFLFGRLLFSGLAEKMDTKRAILLALIVYTVVAMWGFFLNSVVEFWALAWMVAIVQGGSQGLSRSLYSAMSPATKSGEFFGLYGVMEKFSAIIGPLIFAAVGIYFGSSRPAILSLIVLFIIGGVILMRVDVDEGKRVAREEDAQVLGQGSGD